MCSWLLRSEFTVRLAALLFFCTGNTLGYIFAVIAMMMRCNKLYRLLTPSIGHPLFLLSSYPLPRPRLPILTLVGLGTVGSDAAALRWVQQKSGPRGGAVVIFGTNVNVLVAAGSLLAQGDSSITKWPFLRSSLLASVFFFRIFVF